VCVCALIIGAMQALSLFGCAADYTPPFSTHPPCRRSAAAAAVADFERASFFAVHLLSRFIFSAATAGLIIIRAPLTHRVPAGLRRGSRRRPQIRKSTHREHINKKYSDEFLSVCRRTRKRARQDPIIYLHLHNFRLLLISVQLKFHCEILSNVSEKIVCQPEY
jgi:hypothetical protein